MPKEEQRDRFEQHLRNWCFHQRSFRCVFGRNRDGSFSSDDYRTLKVCQTSALTITAIAGGEATLMTFREVVWIRNVMRITIGGVDYCWSRGLCKC
jgi:hypothetical protein